MNPRSKSGRRGGSRVFIFIILLFAFIATFAFVAYFLVYRNYVSELNGYKRFHSSDYESPVYPELTDRQILNLGWAHRKKRDEPIHSLVDPKEPKLSYIHFPFEKKDRVFRIGTFGDSFTEGVEAGYGFDYPSLLQENFDKAGFDSVEIINFGVGGYGVHQSYLLFEYLGSKYNLDAIILQPFFFHYTRDNSFTYEHDYLPIHARYILENNNLKLLDVLGNSMQETADIYHRFSPKNQYLKYDIKTPNFLKSVFSDFNPFYYTGVKTKSETQDELLKTYSIILDNFARTVKQVIVVCHDQEIYRLMEKVTLENITFYQSQLNKVRELSNSLYTAPVEHFSPLGNQFVADELFHLLSGKYDSLSIVKLAFNDSLEVSPDGLLAEYDEVSFRIEGSNFHLYTRQGQETSNVWSIPFDLKKSAASIFLLLSDKLSNIQMLPLSFIPKSGDGIFVSPKDHTRKQIGKLEALNPFVFRLILQDNLFEKSFQKKDDVLESITEIYGKDTKLFFGNHEVNLKNHSPYKAVIRSQGNEHFNIKYFSEGGLVKMILKRNDTLVELPFLKWRKELFSMPIVEN